MEPVADKLEKLKNAEKRKPKNPIKFLIPLNEEQKQAKSIILDNKITVLKGQAGSGKSMLAAQIALDLLFRQKQAKADILINTVTLLKGQAGSGKTLLACQIALDMYFNRQIEKIIITRPNVASADDIGYLPGSMKEKMDPWLAPIYANLYMLYNKVAIDKMVENQDIEILPFAFVRGRTFVNAVVIVDEAQNVNRIRFQNDFLW